MTTRRAIPAVLHNFLETYSSRYSDHQGYWVFGMLGQFEELSFDLLCADEASDPDNPMAAARRLAAAKFSDQLRKADVKISCLLSAQLRLVKSPEPVSGWVGSHWRTGANVNFIGRVVTDKGKIHECQKRCFVSPHDDLIERRRAQENWG